jgi:hypothetical protein
LSGPVTIEVNGSKRGEGATDSEQDGFLAVAQPVINMTKRTQLLVVPMRDIYVSGSQSGLIGGGLISLNNGRPSGRREAATSVSVM